MMCNGYSYVSFSFFSCSQDHKHEKHFPKRKTCFCSHKIHLSELLWQRLSIKIIIPPPPASNSPRNLFPMYGGEGVEIKHPKFYQIVSQNPRISWIPVSCVPGEEQHYKTKNICVFSAIIQHYTLRISVLFYFNENKQNQNKAEEWWE